MQSQSAPSDFLALRGAAWPVFGLWGFWVAQPLYDLISRNLAFLIAHGGDAGTVILLAVALSFAAPAVLLAAIGLATLAGRRTGLAAYGIITAGLFAAMTLLLARNAALPAAGTGASLGLALCVGVACAAASIRIPTWNRILSWLGIAALVFPVLFVFQSPLLRAEPAVDSAPAVSIASRTPTVLVVLDEFPLSSLLDERGGVDRQRSPHLAAFADQSLWFREATAVASDTNLAVPAILTGRYPRSSVAPILSRYPENLFTLLRGNGRMEAFEEITRLCPENACNRPPPPGSRVAQLRSLLLDTAILYLHVIAPASVSASLPPIDGSWSGFVASAPTRLDPADVVDTPYRGRWRGFGDLLRAIREQPEARLYFLHLLAPHAPWNTLPSGKEFGPVELFPHGFAADRVGPDAWEATQGLQRHLLQVVFVDQMLGDLFDALRAEGLYERALVIIASDHGASFEPGQNRRYLTASNFADLLAVPLFVKLPRQHEGETVDRPVETIDILPTIADVLEIEIPWQIDGRSLLDRSTPERRVKHAYHGKRLGFDPRAISLGRDETTARIRSRFGSGIQGLFQIGPHPELIGRDVASLEFDELPATSAVSLDHPQRLEQVDLTSHSIPAHFTGALSLAERRNAPIALAVGVNGRIAAVTQSYTDPRGAAAFSALIPEAALISGRNRVEFLRILDTERGLRFRLLPRRDQPLALIAGAQREVIRVGTREIPIVPDAVTGTAVLSGGGITGVAARREERRPVDELVLFADGEPIFRGRPGGLPDLIDEVEGASFRIALPSDLADRTRPGRSGLRIFGLTDEAAGELSIQYPQARTQPAR